MRGSRAFKEVPDRDAGGTEGVRRAVILAAGVGSRLGDPAARPKCLMPVGPRTLLEHQLTALARAGVGEVVMVVGYESAQVERAARAFAGELGLALRFILNARFAETNTLYSQYLAREWLCAPCFCCNGDVLFAPSVLARLAAARGDAALAIDLKPCGAEEVKVITDDTGRVRAIGKDLDPSACLGEFIGVARYGARAARAFAGALAEDVAAGHERAYFERSLARIAAEVTLAALELRGEPMIEIDFPEDYQRACREVWPRIEGGAR